MKAATIAAILIAILASVGFAQTTDEPARFETFAGYSFQRSDQGETLTTTNGTDLTQVSRNLNGFNFSGTGYLTKRFGIVGDFSAHFRKNSFLQSDSTDSSSSNVSRQSYNLLVGPQFRFSSQSRLTPFVRAMAGAQINRSEFENLLGSDGATRVSFSNTASDFALGFGGGLDVKVNHRISVRAFQFDYIPVFERDSNNYLGTGLFREGEVNNTARFSFGVVF